MATDEADGRDQPPRGSRLTEALSEFAAEAAFVLISVGVFIGAAAIARSVWNKSPLLAIGLACALIVIVAIGATYVFAPKGQRRLSTAQKVIVGAALAVVIVLALAANGALTIFTAT